MYNPKLGRFIQSDPIGFKAGDENLYRFVSNNPTNSTDPSGLQEVAPNGPIPDIEERQNQRDSTGFIPISFGIIISWTHFPFGYPSRDTVLEELNRMTGGTLPRVPAGWTIRGASGGQNLIGIIPPNTVLGVSGAGPCVGVILIPPRPDRPTCAFHFAGGDAPEASLRTVQNLRGYRAIICGAERQNDPELADNSANIARWVRRWLTDRGIPIDGYVTGPNAYVDRNGMIYWNVPEGIPLSGYE